MSRLTIRLLGSPQVELDGAPVRTDRRKAVALLAYLAVTGGSPTRESLGALFWPDYGQSQAFAYLRRTLWELNQILGEGWVVSTREGVGINPAEALWVDVLHFDELLAEVRPPQAVVSMEARAGLEEAVALYRGEFLAGFTLRDSPGFDDWQATQAEHYRLELGAALQALAGICRDQAEFTVAIEYGRRWLLLDHLNEKAHRLLMELYAQGDMRTSALRQYEECARLLKIELKTAPEPATTALYRKIKEEGLQPSQATDVQIARRQEPAQTSISITVVSLPVLATPFVGRETELEAIAGFLDRPECRLLTLLGPGGIGKTRLGIQAAAAQAGDFPHGVYFVPLTPLSSPILLVPGIAEALKFVFRRDPDRAVAQQDPKDQLLDYLREKQMLLVMDNFEHLVEGAVLLSDLLAAAPGLKILVTTRERLNLSDEWVFEVEGMAFPLDGDLESLEKYSAVRLFLINAQKAQASFVLSPEDRPYVSRICQLVQGMPLGIELAAAWIKVLSCREIAQEIERSLDFLTSSWRETSTRHRSLRAVFEHSWNLLPPPEQTALKHLSVFRAAFSREAAEQVADASLAILTSLVDKSLLHRLSPANVASIGIESRERWAVAGQYVLHEVLKQFAAEKLAEDAQLKIEIQERHCDYFLSKAAEIGKQLTGASQVAALAQLEARFDDMRVAWNWALDTDRLDCLWEVTLALNIFYDVTRRYSEGEETFWTAGAHVGQQYDPHTADVVKTRLLALLIASQAVSRFLNFLHEDNNAALPPLIKSIELANTLPAGIDQAIILTLVRFGFFVTDSEQAAACYERCLDIFKKAGDCWWEGLCMMFQADLLENNQYKNEQAKGLFQQSLAIFRDLGDRWNMKHCLQELASIAYWLGDYPQARQLILESQVLSQEMQDVWDMAYNRLRLGQIATELGDYEEAKALYLENLQFYTTMGHRRLVGVFLDCLGYVELLQGHIDQAEAYDQRALEHYRRIEYSYGQAFALNNLADVLMRKGDYIQARLNYQRGLEILRGLGELWGVTKCLKNLGQAAYAQGKDAEALEFYRQALEMGFRIERPPEIVEILVGLARLARRGDQLKRAVEMLSLVVAHPATPLNVRTLAEQELAQIASLLPEAEFAAYSEAGKTMQLQDWRAEVNR